MSDTRTLLTTSTYGCDGSLSQIYPELLGTMLTPKADELVADPFRHERTPSKFFEDGYTKVFARIREGAPPDFPITVFYAFKQAEGRR